jgi:hypothetical protein
VADRRRILLAVEPRVLADALAEMLGSVGLDEVLSRPLEPADDPTMHLDAAIITPKDHGVIADVVIELGPHNVAHVTNAAGSQEVALRTPYQLLQLLDRFCPTEPSRCTSHKSGHSPR